VKRLAPATRILAGFDRATANTRPIDVGPAAVLRSTNGYTAQTLHASSHHRDAVSLVAAPQTTPLMIDRHACRSVVPGRIERQPRRRRAARPGP
jgi:hypothetical protein